MVPLGTYPPPARWGGGEGLPQGTYPPAKVPIPPGIGQHMEYLIRHGQYASCVHAGGLSRLLLKILKWKFTSMYLQWYLLTRRALWWKFDIVNFWCLTQVINIDLSCSFQTGREKPSKWMHFRRLRQIEQNHSCLNWSPCHCLTQAPKTLQYNG